MTETLGFVIENPIANRKENAHYQLKTGYFNSCDANCKSIDFGDQYCQLLYPHYSFTC